MKGRETSRYFAPAHHFWRFANAMNLQHRLKVLKSFIIKSGLACSGVYIGELFILFLWFFFPYSMLLHSKPSQTFSLNWILIYISNPDILHFTKSLPTFGLLFDQHRWFITNSYLSTPSLSYKSTPRIPVPSKKWIPLGFHLFLLPSIQRYHSFTSSSRLPFAEIVTGVQEVSICCRWILLWNSLQARGIHPLSSSFILALTKHSRLSRSIAISILKSLFFISRPFLPTWISGYIAPQNLSFLRWHLAPKCQAIASHSTIPTIFVLFIFAGLHMT